MTAREIETSRRIRRVLLVRTDRLGDVVLTLPMLPVLRRSFPEAHIAFLVSSYSAEIVEGNPYVNELLRYDDDGRPVPFGRMLAMLRRGGYDAAIVAHPTLRLGWLLFRAGIPLRVGTGYRYYSLFFNRRVWEHRKDARRHEVDYNLRLLGELGCDPAAIKHDPEFLIEIPPEARRRVEELLESLGIREHETLVIVHPSSGGSAREWSAANFGALAAKLITERNFRVAVTGAQGEEAQVDKVVTATAGKAVRLVGMLRLKELAALIRSAKLFISNSTGPLHIAVAVGTPVVAFYPQKTAMSARRWGPYSGPSRVLVPNKAVDCSECSGKKGTPCACMDSITVEQAFEAASSLLDERHAQGRGVAAHG